jgi:hypothetical protein
MIRKIQQMLTFRDGGSKNTNNCQKKWCICVYKRRHESNHDILVAHYTNWHHITSTLELVNNTIHDKKRYQHTNHNTITTHQLDNGISISFIIYNTCTASLLTTPCASMLTGQGLLPLAPSIHAQKMTTMKKNGKKNLNTNIQSTNKSMKTRSL